MGGGGGVGWVGSVSAVTAVLLSLAFFISCGSQYNKTISHTLLRIYSIKFYQPPR